MIIERWCYVCVSADGSYYFAVCSDGGVIGVQPTYHGALTLATGYATQFYLRKLDAMRCAVALARGEGPADAG